MSWLFSQALVEEYSEGTSLDGEPYAQLNVMPTPHKFWRNDKTMKSSDLSRFGLTLRLLTEDHGAALLTWFREVSLARTSALPVRAPAYPKAQDLDFGAIKHGSFAKWNLHSHGWKTVQRSLFGDSSLFLEIWPKWGSMQNGVCLEVDSLAPPIKETESGFWHPTPTARDWKGASNGQKEDFSRWTTWLHKNISHDHYTTYPNPSCSEKVMGWPIGWTELEPLGMDKFQQWQQQHGGF